MGPLGCLDHLARAVLVDSNLIPSFVEDYGPGYSFLAFFLELSHEVASILGLLFGGNLVEIVPGLQSSCVVLLL
jgi:hypothetical protein